jgi:hypothetical protein
MMESEERAEREDLSPAEALASTKVAREALARRVAVPWPVDALLAVGNGLFLWMVMEPPFPWMLFVIALWPLGSLWVRRAVQRRAGVESEGLKRRVSGRMGCWFLAGTLAVWISAIVLDVGWGITRLVPVAAGVCAVMLYVFFRGINRRAIDAIRDAA